MSRLGFDATTFRSRTAVKRPGASFLLGFINAEAIVSRVDAWGRLNVGK